MEEVLKMIAGDLFVDDRGSVLFVNGFDFTGVKRFYAVENHEVGLVRAWHGHKREGKYLTVLRGAAMVSAVRIDDWDTPSKNNDVHRYIISATKPSVLWIPPGYANGFKSLVPNTLVVVFSTATLDESKSDDYRWPPDSFGDTWTVLDR